MFNILKNPFNINKREEIYKIDKDNNDDDNLKEVDIKIVKDDNVVFFVKSLFTFLKKYEMCFLSGTIIFRDNNNKLFNFLIFDNINNNNCNGKVKATSAHYTLTHKDVYEKDNVKSVETCVEDFFKLFK
jgi:hypothetical protein